MTRFWDKVDKTISCWLWTGVKTAGYGRFKLKSKYYGAHRVSWELANGKIPKGLMVLHRCDNPLCVNPSHLFLGSPKDNTKDMIHKNRDTIIGSRNSNSKLTEKLVREIKTKYQNYDRSLTEVATKYNVSRFTIGNILLGKSWKHVTI